MNDRSLASPRMTRWDDGCDGTRGTSCLAPFDGNVSVCPFPLPNPFADLTSVLRSSVLYVRPIIPQFQLPRQNPTEEPCRNSWTRSRRATRFGPTDPGVRRGGEHSYAGSVQKEQTNYG